MRRVLTLIVTFSAVGISAGVGLATGSWWKGALVALGCAVLAFAKKVWGELEPAWAKRLATLIDQSLAILFDRYQRVYADHLYYKHRTFDVKGFSTQGKFALELEAVYVELSVDPALIKDIPQDPIRLPPITQKKGRADIFGWLRAESGRHTNFAVVGAPGSGKTTLLKHLALVMAAGERSPKLTPLLLFLRDHATTIEINSEVTLTELAEQSLKNLPPPPGWFQRRLKGGQCLVMLDGLDEVANPDVRRKVVRWVERQVETFGANRFLLTSRPNGYRDNPLSGFTALRLLPFTSAQVERFVRNWYLANELAAYQKDDPGVRMAAEEGANDLLARLHRTPSLQELAVNPLLLTLIATVHRYHSELPGRRVELFAEICDVFLGRRQQARGMELNLTPAQKIRILRVLAYHMMCHQRREIAEADATYVIADTLKQVMPNSSPSTFLQMVEDSSGLLVQKENAIYGFVHLTFQEYLASLHIREEKLVTALAAYVGESWWHETARLYSAQADASPIIENILRPTRPDINALLLATDCEAEALELREDLRERLENVTEGAVEDSELERRRLAAEHMLARRIRNMKRVDDDHYLDTSPVSHAEYQLFIDESRNRSEFLQPEHWNSYVFPKGTGGLPIIGIRKRDAEAFCRWLSDRTTGEWSYALPETTPVDSWVSNKWKDLRFFSQRDLVYETVLSGTEILGRIQQDRSELVETGRLSRRKWWRLTFFVAWFVVRMESRYQPIEPKLASLRKSDLTLASGVRDDLARALSCDFDYKPAANRALSRTLGRTLVRTLERDVACDFEDDLRSNLEHELDRAARPVGAIVHNIFGAHVPDKDLATILNLIRGLERALGSDAERDFELALELTKYVDIAAGLTAVFFALSLNDLCLAEERANGTIPPAATSLWLAKVRNTAREQSAAAANS